jgi:hypothetical protein
MDAEYLKGCVNEALTEALSSMAAEMPEDKIEYIGRYLKSYVVRKKAFAEADEERKESESSWAAEAVKDDVKKADAAKATAAVQAKADQLTTFLEGFAAAASSKSDAMNQATQFVADYLEVPAAYLAIKKNINEADTLCYVSANSGQEFVVGQKLNAPAAEEEEGVTRQGISFDAFKVPEAPEVEAPEDAPEDWAPPPPPGPQPVLVENCMRDNRVKFFGIPKLGAYAAISLKFSSCDHVEGCVPAEAAAPAEEGGEEAPPAEEGGAPAENAAPAAKWQANKSVTYEYVIAMDTVGNYRTFTAKDVEVAKAVGEGLMKVFESIEGKMFDAHVAFLDSHTYGEKVAELVAPLAEQEGEAVAAVGVELTPEPAPEPAEGEEPAEVAPVSELLKACKESKAVAGVHASMIAGEEFAAIVADMANHALPPAPAVEKLLYVASCLTGLSAAAKDAGGDVSFEAMKTGVLPGLAAAIAAYDSEAEVEVAAAPDAAIAAIKEYVEANAVVPGEYPASLPALAPIATWVGKAIAARDAAVGYYTEEKQTSLEK